MRLRRAADAAGADEGWVGLYVVAPWRHCVRSAVSLINAEVTMHVRRRQGPTDRRRPVLSSPPLPIHFPPPSAAVALVGRRARSVALTNYLPSKQIRPTASRRRSVGLYGSNSLELTIPTSSLKLSDTATTVRELHNFACQPYEPKMLSRFWQVSSPREVIGWVTIGSGNTFNPANFELPLRAQGKFDNVCDGFEAKSDFLSLLRNG